MRVRIQETATVSLATTNYKKALTPIQTEWTARNLGIELEEKLEFTKKDFERALKKVSRKIKK